MPRNIGEMIKAARKRQGLTQGELGAALQPPVSAASVCEIEGGDRKSNPSPEAMVQISLALHDQTILQQFCNSCPVRDHIIIRKFVPLNNIIPGTLPAAMKNIEKMAVAIERLQQMVPKMLNKGFAADPDFLEIRNDTIILAIDVRRGLETLFDQMLKDGNITVPELKQLEYMEQQMCIAKGHYIEEGHDA